MKASTQKGRGCIFLHKWETVYNNGFTTYRECKRCEKREVTQPKNSGYQPVDWDWLTFEKNTLNKSDISFLANPSNKNAIFK